MNIIKFDFNEMVTLSGNQVMTTSLKVAQYFNKRHDNVLRGISKLECSDEFRALNFEETNYIDSHGRIQRLFKMTKNGFIFLVMGFTGKASAKIKESYINAFDWMAEQLTKIQNGYMNQYNDLMFEYKTEKKIASQSGRLLRDWGRNKKPNLINKIERLENKLQLDWVNISH